MSVIVPEEAELVRRITEHVQARPGNPTVSAVWNGYISGLLEWGLIDPNLHARLLSLLPSKEGRLEVCEILAGPDHVDAHPEVVHEIELAP